eukprot:SAG11_NODE_14443_length_611_cov_4.501953_1_plen_63_part_01
MTTSTAVPVVLNFSDKFTYNLPGLAKTGAQIDRFFAEPGRFIANHANVIRPRGPRPSESRPRL